MEGYADWLGGYTEDDPVYAAGVTVIASKLRGQREYAAAMEWMQSAPDLQNHYVENLYYQWESEDPAAAAAWGEGPDFPGF
jgi:hypothetical protein